MARKIDITTKMGCKVDCRFCPQKLALSRYYSEDPKRETVMSFENYKKFMDKIPSDVYVQFSGMCEPWLNPDCTRMVEYAVSSGRTVDVYSTLLGMTMEDYERLSKLKVNNFVLHAADKDVNAKIPVTGEYLTLLEAVVEGHRSGKFPITTISVHGDFHPQIVSLMEKIADVPVLREIYDRAGNLEDKEGVTTFVEKEKTGRITCSKCNGDKLDVNYLLPDGTVLLCPMDWGMEYVLGNLSTDSYDEISEGERKQEYRRRLKSEKNGKMICRLCHASQPYLSYKSAEVKSNLKSSIRKIIKG